MTSHRLFLQVHDLVLNRQEFLKSAGSPTPRFLAAQSVALYVLIFGICLSLPLSCHFMRLWLRGEANGCVYSSTLGLALKIRYPGNQDLTRGTRLRVSKSHA